MKKARYSLLEEHLQSTVRELGSSHATFDPSWFLISRFADPTVDSALMKRKNATRAQGETSAVKAICDVIKDTTDADQPKAPVFQDISFLSGDQIGLLNSNITSSRLSNGSSNVVIDTTAYPPELDMAGAVSHVRDLARLLSHPQPSILGLLECLGVMKSLDSLGRIPQFEFEFSVPSHLASPASLWTYLLRPSIPLDAKFRLARCVARGVVAVHCADFVHKNIRPGNILVLRKM